MRRTGTALAVVGILALVVGITLGAANVLAANTGDKNASPATNQVINFPSYPLTGGPYLVGATYDAPNTRIVLVFNQKIGHETLDLVLTDGSDDFVVTNSAGTAIDLTVGTLVHPGLVGATTYDNVVYINGITLTDNALNRIRLKIPSAIGGPLLVPPTGWSTDMSWRLIGSGPIPLRVQLSQATYMNDGENTTLDAQTIIIDWNVATTIKAASANAAFITTPEFNGAALQIAGGTTVQWTISRNPAVPDTPHFLKFAGGISKLRIASQAVQTALSVGNDRALSLAIENRPPYLIAAYYVDLGSDGQIDGQDKLWAVFNEPILEASIDGAFEDIANPALPYNFLTAAGWPATGGGAIPAWSGYTMSSVVLSGFSALDKGSGPLPDFSTDVLIHNSGSGGNPLEDYLQASELAQTSQVVIRRGPGIIKAIYDDRQTPGTLRDDRLVIWLCEPIANDGVVDTTDFVGNGEWFFGHNEAGRGPTKYVLLNDGGLCRITFTDFSYAPAGKNWRPGARIKAFADGTAPTGASSGDPLSTIDWIPITDESRPIVQLTQFSIADEWSTDYNGAAPGVTKIDKVTLGFHEVGASDDGDQYFLFIAKQIPDVTWLNLYLPTAIPLGNRQSGILDTDTTKVSLLFKPDAADPDVPGQITKTTDNLPIVETNQIYFVLASADYTGNVQYYDVAQAAGDNALLFAPVYIGGQCPPIDFSATDDDLIHVVGDTTAVGHTYGVFGDPGSVTCMADSVKAYVDNNLDLDDNWETGTGSWMIFVGHGPVVDNGTTRSFPRFDLLVDRIPAGTSTIYLSTRLGVGAAPSSETLQSDWTPILFDRNYPTAMANTVYDPWNPYLVYGPDDYMNIRMQIDDVTAFGTSSSMNDCARIWADFSGIDSLATAQTGFGVPSAVVMVGLGRDRVDNDHDWVKTTGLDNCDVGYYVGGTQNAVTGVWTGGTLVGAGNSTPNFGDPWVDENGNGRYDQGETFIDLIVAGPSAGRWDCGEPNLDSNDLDEQGWYEVQKSGATVALSGRGTIKQGYPLTFARMRKLAYTDPLSLVTLNVRDNAIDATGEYMLPATDLDRSLNQTRVLDGKDPLRRFLPTTDYHEPTVAEFTSVKNGIEELLEDTNPVYAIGADLDFTISTPSDNDVLMLRMQFKANSATTWTDLSLDPVGDYPTPATPDGAPGVKNVDDDVDGLADLLDLQVKAAMDTVLCKSDFRDNDNDGFFVFRTFAPGDPVVPTNAMGQIWWYNVDESKGNAFDDNKDGALYDAGEGNEAVGYNPALDNDEDGIPGGEAVAVRCDGVNVFLANYTGLYPITIYVAASKIYGTRTTTYAAGNDTLSSFYANGMPYTEVVERAFGLLTARDVLTPDVANSEKRFFSDIATVTPTITPWDIDRSPAERRDAATSGTTFGNNWGYDNEFTWSDSKGSALSLARLAQLYLLTADGATRYQLRGVPYDIVGNTSERWTEPITFTIDLTRPLADIVGCGVHPAPAAPNDFFGHDVAGTAPIEIWDAGQHPGTYTLELATVSSDAVSVLFQERRQRADGTWPIDAFGNPVFTTIGTDVSAPFSMEWPADGQMFTVNNYPAARYQDVQFRALATDAQNNTTLPASACVFNARVIDSTPPSSWIRGVYRPDGDFYEDNDFEPLGVTVSVPQDSSINVWVRIEDNDKDAKGRLTTLLPGKSTGVLAPAGNGIDDDLDGEVDEAEADGQGEHYPYTTMWAAGVDGKTGNALADDDGIRGIDLDDLGGLDGPDRIFTLGAGPLGDDQWLTSTPPAPPVYLGGAGADSIPGPWYDANGVLQPSDDEWGRGTNNDDYITNDVKYVVWQYRRVNPPTEWLAFATVHGDDGTGGQVFDYTQPMKATLNTTDFVEGIYELRAYACDVEGNCNIDTAPIATIAVRANPLRAYIQPEVCSPGSSSVFDLYAVHFIHDYEIDKVRFEYARADTNGCVLLPANPDSAWHLIDIDHAAIEGDSRGDAVLYMPGQFVPVTNPDPIQTLGDAISLNPPNAPAPPFYKYWDADGDGYYSSRDPVVSTGPSLDLIWINTPDPVTGVVLPDADDVGVIGDPAAIPAGATLSNFRTDEFFAQRSTGETDPGLDPTDWIFRENNLNGPPNHLDLWHVTWDATGLPARNYLVRARAIDAQNNIDDLHLTTCYAPDVQNPEEVELINLSTTPPHATFTNMIVPGELPDTSWVNLQQTGVIYVPGSAKWAMLNCTAASATKVKFEYKIEGIRDWTVITPNDDDIFFADIDGNAGYSGVTGLDEVFNDLDHDFVKSAGDFVQDDGVPSGVQTPNGWPMYPQTSGESDTYAIRSHGSLFHVYLNTKALLPTPFPALLTDTSIQLRVTAYDEVCDGERGDPNPEVVTIIWGENDDPVADVIRAEDPNGDLVDVSPATHDHTPVGTIGADMDPLRVFVTAEDVSTIDRVELFYRLDPSCYVNLPEDKARRAVDLVVLLDGSAPQTADDWSRRLNGVATALGDEGIIPTDGTVSLAVVQFSNGVAGTEALQGIPRTLITSPAIAASLARDVKKLVMRGDGTPTKVGIDAAVAAIGAGTSGARRVIVIVTDGPPTVPAPNSLAAAVQAADSAMVRGIDEIHVIGVGPLAEMNLLAQLVRHGSTEHVPDTGVATAIGNKIQSVIFGSLVELRRWKSMTVAGLTSIDSAYPYDFDVATGPILEDGVYQFYPRAYDKSGNYNQAPLNPWGFKKFQRAGLDFATVSEPAASDTAGVGDEYVIRASLPPADADMAPAVAVRFFYAYRILEEVVNADEVQPMAPFKAPALNKVILGSATGDGVVIKINRGVGIYHSDLADVSAPTKLDFTVDGNQIVFGAPIAASDTILVSYNFKVGEVGWRPITEGDTWNPYTVAWSQADGGVPGPVDLDTDAYDLIAVAKFDVNGDGTYENDPVLASDPPNACDYNEPQASEGRYLILRDEGLPNVTLYGLAFNPNDDRLGPDGIRGTADDGWAYLDSDRLDGLDRSLGFNWPGNPLFDAGDELRGGNYENKLSGIESDVFVTVNDDIDGADVPSVRLDISATSLVNGAVSSRTFDMTKISAANEEIDIPVTFYQDDYPQWVSGSIENVILRLKSETAPRSGIWVTSREYRMVPSVHGTRADSALARFDVGGTQRYEFVVDLVGDEQAAVPDARNFFDPAGPEPPYSALKVPATPFWYKHFDNTGDFLANAVHRVKVRATDNEGNIGTNLTDGGQGDIVFFYDPTPAKVTSIKLLSATNQVLFVDRVGPFGGCSYRLMAEVNDLGTAGGPDVMSADSVAFEYTPNHGAVWIRIGTDSDPTDGMWSVAWTPTDPFTDGYDNNGNGLWDEPAEKQADIEIRVLVYDHAQNIGYSDRQTPRLVFPIRVDAAPPIAALDVPWDGQTFAYTDSIRLEGRAWGDTVPAKATNDIEQVRFQAKVTGYYYLDEDGGTEGVYDNGIDEIWFDANGDGELTQADDPAGQRYPGGDGTYYFDEVHGACAFDSGCRAGECRTTTRAYCEGHGGVWYDASCDANPHGFGACCTEVTGISEGFACHITTEANCAGTWTLGGSCDPSPCVGPATGACCATEKADGCQVTTEADCVGTWWEGADCDPVPCGGPPPVGKRNKDGRLGLPPVQGIALFSHSPWFDLDPTPQDNGDDPWRTLPVDGVWGMDWVPSGFPFITSDELGGDEYIRLRMLSRDAACNVEVDPKETVIILNDDSVTRAYIHHVGLLEPSDPNFANDLVDPAETKAIQGSIPVRVRGTLQAHGAAEVVQVNLYVAGEPDRLVAVVPLHAPNTTVDFMATWDQTNLDTYPDGVYVLFATAVDVDQNETSKEAATRVTVRIDRIGPVVNYTPLGSYAGFTPAASYLDDGIKDHFSMVIKPEEFTGDVNFTVTTTDTDVAEMKLQWRKTLDPAGVWRPAGQFFSPLTALGADQFDHEPRAINGANQIWWLHLENFAQLTPPRLAETGRLEFRALATDEAGNTNALQPGAEYTADNTEPELFDWNDNSVTNQVEVGATVKFEISVQDRLLMDATRTDITRVELFSRVAGTPWPLVPYATVVPDSSQIDTGNAMWIARFDWTAPLFVTHDTRYEFGVLMTDAAGNTNLQQQQRPGGYTITVEDNAAPDRSKLIDIVAVTYSDSSTSSLGSCWTPGNQCSVTAYSECSGTWLSGGTCSAGDHGSCCIGGGFCEFRTQDECLGIGSWTGGADCSPNPCDQPTGSCCASWGDCYVTTPAECNGYGIWTPDRTCTPDPCERPTGPCCTGGGSCSVTTKVACYAGIWSMGGDCSPNPCGQPTGSCCPAVGSCVITYENGCTGVFVMGGTCSPDPCPEMAGSCCNDAELCAVTTEALCQGSWTMGGSCTPSTCTGPSGACCDPNDGSCLLTTETPCVDAGGIWNVGYLCSPNPCSAAPGGKRLKSAENPWLWKDLDGNQQFNAGVDWLISEGSERRPPANGTPGTVTNPALEREENTFPRNVGESFLNDSRPATPGNRNTVKIARTVTLVGRTQSDDDGIGQLDNGIQWVAFVLAPCDAAGTLSARSEWKTLGKDEYQPNFPLFYWHLKFDTTPYADGTYKMAVYAMDEEGNIEDQTSLDWTDAIIVIDNTGPSAEMDKTPLTPRIEPEDRYATVERNLPFTLFARTLKPGSHEPLSTEDDAVYFLYKRATDLNMPDSWGLVNPLAGYTVPGGVWEDGNGNPDNTRPYSFDVNMTKLTEPTDDETPVPLSVGEAYDFGVATEDEVANWNNNKRILPVAGVKDAVVAAYNDTIPGTLGARHLRLLIQDTIAPHLEFTSAVRKGGDPRPIENPTKIHAQGFLSITAKLLTGDLDMDHAEFVYRKLVPDAPADTSWSLIDAVLTPSDYARTWTLGEWDLQTLQHNVWYQVACVGVDDVGNVDQKPDVIDVYVDYEAPPFTLVSPDPMSSKWCNGIMDLVIQVDRGAQQQHDDVWDVDWMWKKSTDKDSLALNQANPASPGWKRLGVPSLDLYDDATNKYSNTLNLNDDTNGSAPGGTAYFSSGLYDLRVEVKDFAGNVSVYDVYDPAHPGRGKNTVDMTPPDYVQISNIKVDGDDTTQDPNDGTHPADQFTDVTAGSAVEIFATASDNERDLPDFADPQTGVFYETMIATLQFQVAYDLNQDGTPDVPPPGSLDRSVWHDIGLVHLDPPTLGDMSAQTASILWNTSGLPEGDFFLQVIAADSCGNERTSPAPVNVRINDWTPPIARIVAWDADQQPHGTPATSFLTIYALAECDTSDADRNPTNGWQPSYDVQLQYNVKDATEAVPTGDWINIGIAKPMDAGNRFTTEHIWAATVDPMLFGDNVTSVWLRALVKDDSGNRYGDDPADIVPTMLANVVRAVDDLGVEDGTITLEQVPSADLQSGAEMVEKVSIMVESPTHVIVTAKMAVQDQMPRAILLWEPSEPDANQYPSGDNPENLSPGTDDGLVRSLDDPTVWRGEFNTQGAECNLYGIWVTGLDGTVGTAMWIDMKEAYFREFPVTSALGTNGTVVTPAYVNLGSKVVVPSGSWSGSDACLIVSPTEPPITSRDQERYLQPVDKTAYHLELQADPLPFTHGYEPLVTLKYSSDLALAALTQTEGSAESDLTVRRWNPKTENRDGTTGAWVGTGLTHIKAYPDNNEVVFRVDNLTNPFGMAKDVFARSDSSAGNVFQLFAPKQTAPVLVSNIWPNSPYVTDWWTDADPVIVVYLRDPGGQVINPNEVELLIDGEYWATWLTGDGSAQFIRGNGAASIEYANQDSTVMELVYHHSTYPKDWLANGAHRLTVRYRALNGTDDWMEMKDFAFNVDRKSPYIEFDGGFVTNPNLSNVVGYMNPQHGKLVVKMYDEGMGILFKHDRPWYYADLDCDGILNPNERQFDPVPYPDSTWLDPAMRGVNCWLRADWGMKYDVWRIHTPDQQPPHDHQNDIDNIEVRTLLHQGTANDLEPWIMQNGARITLDEYDPTDTLVVPVPVLGGGVIKDNDIVEITWYSDKSIEQNSDGPGFGCIVDTVLVNGTTRLFWDPACAYDAESQEMHIYNEGIQDWASNSGSKYVEQRFIVDMSCPTITFVEPATSIVDPNGDMHVVVAAADAGVGMGRFKVEIMDPLGNPVTPSEVDTTQVGRYEATVRRPLQRGEYTIKAVAADRLGTGCEKALAVKVEALVLAMTEAAAAPNPYNPQGTDKALGGLLNIGFNLEKKADVTIKVYDFAGLEVATVANQKTLEAGYRTEPWAGEASDHTALANGAYILRITATDGVKTVEQNLKLVIWRE